MKTHTSIFPSTGKNNGKLTTKLLPLAVAVAFCNLPQIALAQSERQAATMEEVVVTARRRDESLANVPIAITAMSAEQLQAKQIKTDSDLQAAVPGLTIRQTQGNNSLTYSIRGQTADTFSGSPSAVVTYFNDVPLTVAGASTIFDLESVQVLKGPQGTLFGRNATGGAVLFTPAKPSDESEGAVTVRAGNYSLAELEAMVNLPLSDSLALRLAATTLTRDGYIDDIITGDDLGELDRQAVRASLAWSPNDQLENILVAQYGKAAGTNTGASYVYSIYDVGETNNGFALNPSSSFLIPFVEQQRELGPYKTQHPAGADHEGKDWIVTNTTTFALNDNLTLKNILGISHAFVDTEQPQLGAPFATILTANIDTGESGNETDADSISEEIQLQGETSDGKFNYIFGFYYQDYQVDTLWPQTYFEVSALTDAFRITNESRAIYAQGTYDLSDLVTDGLKFTTGVRYTWEDVEISQLAKSTYKFGSPDQSETFKEPSYEIGLEYQATDELLSYLKTRGSFRSGGFNGAAPPVDTNALAGGNKFDSETVTDVELGLKFRGDLAAMPTTFNIAFYKQWIDDVQRVEFPDPDGPGGLASIAVTANVPEMVVQGFELEASILATQWLELGVSYAYTDAEFTDGNIVLFGNPYSYGPVGDTPENSSSLYFVVDIPVSDDIGTIALRADYYSQSEQYFSNAAGSIAPRTKLSSYDLLNARLSWSNMFGSGLSTALFGKNITDEEYFAGGMTLAAALGHNAAAVGEPRTYGIEFSFQY